MKQVGGSTLPGDRVSRRGQRIGGVMLPGNIENHTQDVCSFWSVWKEEIHSYYSMVPNKHASGVYFASSLTGVATTPLNWLGVLYKIAWLEEWVLSHSRQKMVTSDHDDDDDEVEGFYEDITRAVEEYKFDYTVVMGDFNAEVGIK